MNLKTVPQKNELTRKLYRANVRGDELNGIREQHYTSNEIPEKQRKLRNAPDVR